MSWRLQQTVYHLPISDTVLGSKRGPFKIVFEMAQNTLKSTFGMELVELQTRAATYDAVFGKDAQNGIGKQAIPNKDGNSDEQGDRQGITGLKKRGLLTVCMSASQANSFYFFPCSCSAGL